MKKRHEWILHLTYKNRSILNSSKLKIGRESQNFKAERIMSCLCCCHMVAPHWLGNWNAQVLGKESQEWNSTAQYLQKGFPNTVVFPVSGRQASPLVPATKSMDRTLSQLLRRVACGLEAGICWRWMELRHYCLLFNNMELWFVLGILKGLTEKLA